MDALLALSRGIDRLTAFIGRAVSFAILAAILVSATNAVIRKVFDASSNAWLELQWYLFGAAYLLAAAYALQRNEHIRIDILAGQLPRRVRSWIELGGHLLMLMPFVILVIYEAVPFVWRSIEQGEHSPNAGGLLLWPAKSLILAGFVLLFLQGVSEIIKRIAILAGRLDDPLVEAAGHAPPLATIPD